jgi:hypothetical protein
LPAEENEFHFVKSWSTPVIRPVGIPTQTLNRFCEVVYRRIKIRILSNFSKTMQQEHSRMKYLTW